MPEVKSTDSIIINVNNADNQIKIYLNGREIYSKSTERDPSFHDHFSISTSELRSGYNVLLLIGSNWGGPAHYKANVTVNGRVIAQWDERVPSGNGVVWDASLDFVSEE